MVNDDHYMDVKYNFIYRKGGGIDDIPSIHISDYHIKLYKITYSSYIQICNDSGDYIYTSANTHFS